MEPPLLLTVEQVAELVQISRARIYELVDLDQFPRPIKVGRLSRWKRDDIVAWVESL